MAPATASETTSQVVDLLKQRMADIKGERRELDAEEKRLDRTLSVLNGSSVRRGRPALPAGSSTGTTASSAAPVTKRKRAGGTRAEQAIALVTEAGKDGISASKMAKQMKIKPNYLYRVMGTLEKQGHVKKDGRTYFPPK